MHPSRRLLLGAGIAVFVATAREHDLRVTQLELAGRPAHVASDRFAVAEGHPIEVTLAIGEVSTLGIPLRRKG